MNNIPGKNLHCRGNEKPVLPPWITSVKIIATAAEGILLQILMQDERCSNLGSSFPLAGLPGGRSFG
jgi:hypothetical protein